MSSCRSMAIWATAAGIDLVELRGRARYVAWADGRGRLVRLLPEGQPRQFIALEGWELATGDLSP